VATLCIVKSSPVAPNNRYTTLVDIKYTNGKMNIQTRSTKCQLKSGYFDIVRIVILGLKEQNRCCDDTSDKQRVNSVMKNVIGRNSQPRDQPIPRRWQELLPQCNHAQVK